MAADTPKPVEDVFQRLSQFFKALSLNQRLLLTGGVVLVAGTIWVFVALLGQPKYVTLYSGLRPEEAQALAARLAGKKIPPHISSHGALQVPQEKLGAARLQPPPHPLPPLAPPG